MEVKERILQFFKANSQNKYCEKDLFKLFQSDQKNVHRALSELVCELSIKKSDNRYSLAKYEKGVVTKMTDKGCIVTIDDKSIMVSSEEMQNAKVNDEVSVDIYKYQGKNLIGKVVKVLTNKTKVRLGTVFFENGEYVVRCDYDGKKVNISDNVYLGEKLVLQLSGLKNDGTYDGRVVRKAGHVDDPDIIAKSIFILKEVPTQFSKAAMKQVKNIPSTVREEDIEGRLDLRNGIIIVSIDGDTAKDLDDTISLEKLDNGHYLLGGHIADVSHYVKPGTPIDLEAYAKGTSYYTPGACNPMLPHELSSGICSLFGNVDRLAFSCFVEFDEKLEMVDCNLALSVINSSKRMTYAKVQEVLDGNCSLEYKPFASKLIEMNNFAQKLRAKRMKEGSIDFGSNDICIDVNSDGSVKDIKRDTNSLSEQLVEEFMLALNRGVTWYGMKNNAPFIYRVEDYPDVAKIAATASLINSSSVSGKCLSSFSDTDDITQVLKRLCSEIEEKEGKEVYKQWLIRDMTKAIYSTNNIGHFGLNFPYYTHFTSPIRRYPDLQTHRNLKLIMNNEINELKKIEGDLSAICEQCSSRERLADQCEFETNKKFMARYMANKIGESFTGVVSSITPDVVHVQLTNGVEGVILFDRKQFKKNKMLSPLKLYRIGEPIVVETLEANELNGFIRFKQKILTK